MYLQPDLEENISVMTRPEYNSMIKMSFMEWYFIWIFVKFLCLTNETIKLDS